jgi:DNA invertase Pin-like site-specific DNA recombinase
MSRIGYARVSTTGQSLEVQLEKLAQANCDRIYQEKRSGRTANRPEFQACINYLREGDRPSAHEAVQNGKIFR